MVRKPEKPQLLPFVNSNAHIASFEARDLVCNIARNNNILRIQQ